MLFSSHHMKGTCGQQEISVRAELGHMTELLHIQLFHFKLLFLPSFNTVLLGRKSPWRAHVRSGDLCSTSLGVEHQKILGILLHGRFISSSSGIYLISYL